MSEYLPLTVDAARRIAESFAKSVVVIVAWDSVHNLVHTTTYGVNSTHKVFAAMLGEKLAAAAGCDLNQKTVYEDFLNPGSQELALLAEVRERQRQRRRKYGRGPDDLDHDDRHSIDDWEPMIRDHAARAVLAPPMESRGHLLAVMGLAKSAVEAMDRKAARS